MNRIEEIAVDIINEAIGNAYIAGRESRIEIGKESLVRMCRRLTKEIKKELEENAGEEIYKIGGKYIQWSEVCWKSFWKKYLGKEG